MFPGGRSSQNMPGGNPGFPTTYYRDVAAVSNPSWFGNNPAPVPPPAQYPTRAESGRDLLAESYERMRNEMRSLQGSSTTKYGGVTPAPPPPVVEEKPNPLSQLLENRDVSLSSLLEAAMDPNIGSSKRTEDPIMKKEILDKCEEKIAQLYRLRISGQGMFFPMTQPKIVKYDGVSTLTYNHPRIEFNMLPEGPIWMCPDVAIDTKTEEPSEEKLEGSDQIVEALMERSSQKDKQEGSNVTNPSMKVDVIDTNSLQFPVAAPTNSLQMMMSVPPPAIPNVSYPAVSQYRSPMPLFPGLSGSFARPPLSSGPMDFLAEMDKERRRKEIEMEWDRLMEDKGKKDKKRKKKKRRSESGSSSSSSSRSKSRRSSSRHKSRGQSHRSSYSRDQVHRSHRRSHSRHRSRDKSKDGRGRRRSRSFSLSPSPQRRRTRSPHRPHSRRSRSPSSRHRSSSFLRSLHAELERSPRYRRSPPRNREPYPPNVPAGTHYVNQHPPLMSVPQQGPPGYDNYCNYGPGPFVNNPPPPGMDYGPSYGPGMPPYGPMGPRGPGPWMDPNFGPYMGPGPHPQWCGPRPPMGPRGPLAPVETGRSKPPAASKKGSLKTPSSNLVDLTQINITSTPTQKTPVTVIDITEDSEKSIKNKKDEPTKELENTKTEEPIPDEHASEPKLAEDLLVNKAKVISTLAPPGVSPERETHTKYPNVESEFTRPMRAKFRKTLEPFDKILDKIRLYQRDSFDFKTLIKSLECGKIEFMGVHTLHDGLLCKLEINRQQPDKFFKIVIPRTHVGRLLRAIHSSYHDYSVGKIQRLVEDLFCDPRDFHLSKIIDALKNCKDCIATERKEREALRQKEILILDSTDPAEDTNGPDDEKNVDGPQVQKDRHRNRSSDRDDRDRKRSKDDRSRRPSETEKDEKSRRNSEKGRSIKSKSGDSQNKPQGKSALSDIADTYSKFEDLGVSRKKPPGKDVDKKEAAKKGDRKTEDMSEDPPQNGKKVPASTDGMVSKGSKNERKKDISEQKKATSSNDAQEAAVEGDPGSNLANVAPKPQPKPQQKPTVNPDDFKERVRAVQMAVDNLGAAISDLENLGRKSAEPALLLKAGMLCRRLPPSSGQGKPEVKIVVTPACLEKMVQIVHTMAAVHAPFQKTVTVFNKHFVPIDGLEKAVSDVLNNCVKCASDSEK